MNYSAAVEAAMEGWVFDDPPTVTSFEFEKVDIVYWNRFLNNYWRWSLYLAAGYGVLILGLQHWMAERDPWKLKHVLFLWNASLAVFSLVGFTRVAPPLVNLLSKENGFYDSICLKRGINLPNVLWGLLFVLSKVWELGDTIFIVLTKRRLLFIHWYHHVVTLVVTWYVAPLMEPIGRWYGALNYLVHAFMYPYFALKALDIQLPPPIAQLVTTLQFTQMVVGLSVNFASYYLQRIGYPCVRDPSSILAFSLVYGSFALLFGRLLYQSVVKTYTKARKQD